MISIVQFFKEKDVLKVKYDIQGFKKWPSAIQMIYDNTEPTTSKD